MTDHNQPPSDWTVARDGTVTMVPRLPLLGSHTFAARDVEWFAGERNESVQLVLGRALKADYSSGAARPSGRRKTVKNKATKKRRANNKTARKARKKGRK